MDSVLLVIEPTDAPPTCAQVLDALSAVEPVSVTVVAVLRHSEAFSRTVWSAPAEAFGALLIVTLTVSVSVWPIESVAVTWKVSSVLAETLGAVNEGVADVGLTIVTAVPAVWVHV